MPEHNRFLEGSFAPVEAKITAFGLPVTGSLPAGLSGRYLRNGPNPLGLDDPTCHWFLGVGMVHGVRLRGGTAEWYGNRWVRSKAVAAARGEKWPAGPESAMPLVGIDLHKGAPAERVRIGSQAVYAAMIEAANVPISDRVQIDGLATLRISHRRRGVRWPFPSSTTKAAWPAFQSPRGPRSPSSGGARSS